MASFSITAFLKYFFAAVVGLLVVGCGVGSLVGVANAAPLNYQTSETIYLTASSSLLTIASGSVADALTVNATSVMVTLSSSTGGTFTLLSPSFDLGVATSSGGGTVTGSCTAGVASTTISQSTGSTVYTITPIGSTCDNSGPPVINSFSANPGSVSSGNPSLLSWSVSGASTTVLDNGIGDVSNQTSTSVTPSQTTTYTLTITNNAGSSTAAQATVTVTSSGGGGGGGGGSVSSGGGGGGGGGGFYIAPTPASTPSVPSTAATVTTSSLQAKLNLLLTLLQTLEYEAQEQGIAIPQSSVAGTGGGSVHLFQKELYFGVSSLDVRYLQQFLAKDATIYPSGKVTGYFGALTLKAVELFQKKYGIAKPGNKGYGLVGPLTRTKLNTLMAQGLIP